MTQARKTIALNFYTPSALTALASAAAGLVAGSGAVGTSWRDFGTGPNWGADLSAVSWCTDTLHYDSIRKQVHVGGGWVSKEQKHHHIYDEATNLWGPNTLASQYPTNTISGHFWDTTFAPEWGEYFFGASDQPIYRYNPSSGLWTTIDFGQRSGNGIGWHPNMFGPGDGGLVCNSDNNLKVWQRRTGQIFTLQTYSVANAYNGGSGAYNPVTGKLWIGTGNIDRCWSIATGSGGTTPGTSTLLPVPPVKVIGADDGGGGTFGKVIMHPYTAGKLLCLTYNGGATGTVYESTSDGASWSTAAYTHPFNRSNGIHPGWWSPGSIPRDAGGNYGVIWSIRSLAGTFQSVLWKPPA